MCKLEEGIKQVWLSLLTQEDKPLRLRFQVEAVLAGINSTGRESESHSEVLLCHSGSASRLRASTSVLKRSNVSNHGQAAILLKLPLLMLYCSYEAFLSYSRYTGQY